MQSAIKPLLINSAILHCAARLSCLLSAIFLLASIALADDSKADLAQLDVAASEAELSQMLSELADIKSRLSKDISQHSELDQAFSATEIKIGTISADNRRLSLEQKSLSNQLEQLRKERKLLQKQQEKQQALIGEHIRQAYALGEQSALQIFFEQESPESIDRQLTYLDYINQARAKQIDEYATIVKQKHRISEQIKGQQNTLTANRARLSKQQRDLAQLQLKRRQQLNQLASNIEGHESRVKVLNTDSASLQQLLKEVGEVMASQAKREAKRKAEQAKTHPDQEISSMGSGDFAGAKGRLPWPVSGQQQFRYGKNRPGSDVSWQGVTIKAKSGESVKTIYSGRVIFADWFRGQGLLIIVDHGDGYMSLYGHNQSLLQNAGAWVSAGETIATVGNSGGQSMAALYFEIRHNGAPSDPNRWCSKG